MLADIIIVAIVGVLFVLCIRKQITDHKKGIPSCGLNCGQCTGGSCCESTCSGGAKKAARHRKAEQK